LCEIGRESNAPRGIYQIRCKVTGALYVGSSDIIERRWKWHQRALRDGHHHSKDLLEDWQKYGSEAFEWTILERAAEPQLLLACEKHHIMRLMPVYNSEEVTETESRSKYAFRIPGFTHMGDVEAKWHRRRRWFREQVQDDKWLSTQCMPRLTWTAGEILLALGEAN
jgi:group I intron endonuclease